MSAGDQINTSTGSDAGTVFGRARARGSLPELVEAHAGCTRVGTSSFSCLGRLFCNVPQGVLAIS
eukprot:2475839-Amphidinium_carterae.1